MINVVNKYKHTPNSTNDIYIGRGSPLGNPFPINATNDRDAVCDKYSSWLQTKLLDKDTNVLAALNKIVAIEELTGTANLVCFCKPQRCHGDFIKQVINERKQLSKENCND